MKLITGLVGMLLPLFSVGQSPALRPLCIGDTVPDIVFNNIINYKDSTAILSDFKGKLVILDFWATSCGSCIKAFPKLDSLQKHFHDQLQIMLVSHDGNRRPALVKEYLDIWLKKSSGAFVLPSTSANIDELIALFPHTFIPHYIWIDPARKLIAITSYKDLNAANIQAVLNGSAVFMPLKQE